jgi:phytoene desaturase
MEKHVAIIGSGIGGLATACILGQAGYKVSVYEKNPMPGGRAGLLTVSKNKNGVWTEQKFDKDAKEVFRFDTGPSWYLMPDVFEHFYELLGEDIKKYLDLQRLDPSYQVFFKDAFYGSIRIHGDIKRDGKTFESLEPGAQERLEQFLDRSTYTYEVQKLQ